MRLICVSTLFQSYLGNGKGEHEKLCAMKCHLGSKRISPPVGFKPENLLSEVGSANLRATRTFLTADEPT